MKNAKKKNGTNDETTWKYIKNKTHTKKSRSETQKKSLKKTHRNVETCQNILKTN